MIVCDYVVYSFTGQTSNGYSIKNCWLEDPHMCQTMKQSVGQQDDLVANATAGE